MKTLTVSFPITSSDVGPSNVVSTFGSIQGTTKVTFSLSGTGSVFIATRKMVLQFDDEPSKVYIFQTPLTGINNLQGYTFERVLNTTGTNPTCYTLQATGYRTNFIKDTYSFTLSVFQERLTTYGGMFLVKSAIFDTAQATDNLLLTLELSSSPKRVINYLLPLADTTTGTVEDSQYITVSSFVDPAIAGSTEGDGIYQKGTTVILSAIPNLLTTNVEVGADIILALDESMGGGEDELTWTSAILQRLSNSLIGAGIGSGSIPNRYGLVGFGGSTNTHTNAVSNYPAELPSENGAGHKHYVAESDWGTAAQALTAITFFTKISADSNYLYPTEDAYAAIDTALSQYTWRDDAAKIIIFITDEDRADWVYRNGFGRQAQFDNLKSAVVAKGVNLIGIVTQVIANTASGITYKMGIDYLYNTYSEDGSGSFVKSIYGAIYPNNNFDQAPYTYGYLTSANSTTIVDPTQSWTTDQWVSSAAKVETSAGARYDVTVASNTSTSITFTSTFSAIPVSGSYYQISWQPTQDPQRPGGVQDDYTKLALNNDVKGSIWNVETLLTGTDNEKNSLINGVVDYMYHAIVRQLSWKFSGWYIGANKISNSQVIDFKALYNVRLVAKFFSDID